MPRIERLHQNTPEWHRWRLAGIGSSDAPVIMGGGAFKTPSNALVDQNWNERERLRQSGLAPGTRAGAARKTAPTKRGRASRWSRCAWCTSGWSGCGHRWTGLASMARSCSRSSARWSRRRPARPMRAAYPPLLRPVTASARGLGAPKKPHYWSFDGERGTLVRVKPDPNYIERLIEAETEFWRRVVENHWPEQNGEELDLSGDPRWQEAAHTISRAEAEAR